MLEGTEKSKSRYWLERYLYLVIILFCIFVLITCYFYGASLGLNTRITAGVELDADNIAIALSRLWFGLHKGYVGYLDVYNAFFKIVAPDSNPNNPLNFPLLSDPHTIKAAFANVKKIIPETLPTYSVLSSAFVSVNMEDIGLADFYHLAFLIFGVKPTSMYNMYFFLFSLSIVLFIIEYRKQSVPLILMTLIIGTFPTFFFSDNFSIAVPSLNSNRFMPTLAFIPTLHILCMFFKSKDLNRWQYLRVIGQSILFTFIFTIRSSSQWLLIMMFVFGLFISLKVFWPHRHQLFELDRLRLLKMPIIASIITFSIVFFSYTGIQNKLLNPIYQTDCSLPHHGFWHNIYMSLAMHPNWRFLHPRYANVTDSGDGLPFHQFENYMREMGLDPVCHITNGYNLRLHEIVTKQEYLHFIRTHKRFALQLYTYYKPLSIIHSYTMRISRISLACLLYCAGLSMFLGLFLAYIIKSKEVLLIKLSISATIILFASWLPSIAVYPSAYNNDDLWIFIIYLCFNIMMFTYTFSYVLKNVMKARINRAQQQVVCSDN